MEFSVLPSLIFTSQDVFIQNQNRGVHAALNAALILGQARRNVILFNNNNPRNVVAQGSWIHRTGCASKGYPTPIYEEAH